MAATVHAATPTPHLPGPPSLATVKTELLVEGRTRALAAGLLEGLVRVELIRPDLLSVTLDGAVIGDHVEVEGERGRALGGLALDLQEPEAFRVTCSTVPGFAEGVAPREVHRAAYEWFNARDTKGNWPLAVAALHHHDYFLRLPRPLESGHRYTVTVIGGVSEPRARRSLAFAYDEALTTTKVIKVNTVGYSAAAGRRYAYLGWWQGSGGAVDFDEFTRFDVHEEGSGKRIHQGRIQLRREADPHSGERVYELDLSPLGPGSYHLRIPGLARSEPFTVGGPPIFQIFYHTIRAFLHQRCGQELRAPWSEVRKPACHTEVWESGKLVAGPGAMHPEPGHRYADDDRPARPDEPKRSFRGGYHDAADFDTFSYHLPATGLVLIAYELSPGRFSDGQLNLPESGNGIPDLLDEAAWGLSFHLEHQLPSGAVPLGRINRCDALHQNFAGGKAGAVSPPFGILPPSGLSTPTFAAVAAQFARLIRPYDASRAQRHLEAARRAFTYAAAHSARSVWDEQRLAYPDLLFNTRTESAWPAAVLWAACELLATTGDSQYAEYIGANFRLAGQGLTAGQSVFSYLRLPGEQTVPEIRRHFLAALLGRENGADRALARTEEAAYRMGNGNGVAAGWGRANGLEHAVTLLLAHAITGDRRYLDAAALNADFHRGVNPLAKSFVTGLGTRSPRRPEISWFLYRNRTDTEIIGHPVPGFSIYGLGPRMSPYPGPGQDGLAAPGWEEGWPLWRSWRDVWATRAEMYSEFTVHQTLGPAAFTYARLYALEADRGSDTK